MRLGSTKGARWKVPGSPRGRGGLEYLGEDAEPYKRIYEIKSKDNPKSWEALIQLCKTLTETPAAQLEKALAPMLDLEGVLKFLAWESALASADGFYARASDYDLYPDETQPLPRRSLRRKRDFQLWRRPRWTEQQTSWSARARRSMGRRCQTGSPGIRGG